MEMNCRIYPNNENPFGLNYVIFYPDNFQDLPLLIYLHGAGERGDKLPHLYRHGIPKLIKEGEEFPAVILCPQCPTWAVWDNIVTLLKSMIDSVAEDLNIKKDRICITGSSMGGFGTWMMGETYTNFFSAIAPVAGGGMSWRTPNLQTTPVLAVHGDADTLVPIVYSKLMVDAVNENGGNAELITLRGFEHTDGIDYAYRNTKLISWLLEQRRNNLEQLPETASGCF